MWLVWGLCLPLYRLSDYLLAAGASILAGVVGKKLFPDQTYETPEPKKAEEPQKKLRLTVAVLSLSLAVTLTALMAVLVLYTKM